MEKFVSGNYHAQFDRESSVVSLYVHHFLVHTVTPSNLVGNEPSSRDGLGMWRVSVRRGGCIGSCWGNRREGDHWGDLGVHGWIILGWISRRWDVGIWTG